MNENLLSSGTPKQNLTTTKFSGDAKKDNPGVVVPPPLFYVAIFFLSILLQKVIPISNFIAGTVLANVLGFLFIALWLGLMVSSLQKFIISKNTLITIKPASALQTTGIYSITRNPMYLSLIMLYTGIAMFRGNWYTLLLLPLLAAIVQLYIIKKEENYLERAFGEQYRAYKSGVRRWI